MSAMLTLILPFFGLIGLGFGAGRLRLVGQDGATGLEFFVLYLALPAYFFQAIIAAPPTEPAALSFVVTTAFATYCAFAIAFSIGALANRGNVPEATIQGLAGSYSNIGYLAPALIVTAFGASAAAPTALIFSFDNLVLLFVTPLMMALGGTGRSDPMKIGEQIARRVFLHPIVIATVLGFLAAGSGLRLPEPISAVLSLLGQAAAPMALLAFGLALSLRPIGPVSLEMPAIVAVKLIVHPTIVYLLLSWVGGFDPVWVRTAVLLAALPPAMDVIAIAHRYRVYEAKASTLVLFTAAVSVATVSIAIILLVNGVLPSDPFR